MKLTAESTVFNDEKVQGKFSELIVDADGIRTEVSKKVGNNEIISRINQSAESVKIQADKVNIEGAAIFTGSGRLSTTSLNATYDANGAATGAVNTLKNDLSSASGTTVIDGGHIATNSIGATKIKVDEIEIGAAQIASGTIDVARIPDLSADKITTGTIRIGLIPTTARNDTYITDIDSQDGIIVKAVKGRTDGSDATKKNYIKLNASGLDIYQEGNSVAKYGATSRVGLESGYNVQTEANAISFFNDHTKILSIATITRSGELYTNIGINDTRISINDGTYSSILFIVDQNIETSNYLAINRRSIQYTNGYINTDYLKISDDGMDLANEWGIRASDNASSPEYLDVLRLDPENCLVLGYGLFMKNDSSYKTYVEGYDVILRARNKYYLGSVGGTQITSDRRLKKDIKSIGNNIRDVFMNLHPVEYRAKESADKQKHFGFIAQEVRCAFTENGVDIDDYSIVDEYPHSDNEEIYKTICYTEFIPLCVKMIQAQQKEIESLKEVVYEG